MTEVKLYGWLGKKYGKSFFMDVASPAEAIRALGAQFRQFRKDLINYQLGYHVFVGKKNIGEQELNLSRKTDVIKFVPAVAGAKAGVLQTILGIVIIAVSAYFDYAPGVQLGASLLIGGVIQMLTSAPKSKTAQDDGSNPSYSFNGATNTTAQGHPVPVGYGQMEVGSAVISAAITVGALVSGSQSTGGGSEGGGGGSGDGGTSSGSAGSSGSISTPGEGGQIYLPGDITTYGTQG